MVYPILVKKISQRSSYLGKTEEWSTEVSYHVLSHFIVPTNDEVVAFLPVFQIRKLII